MTCGTAPSVISHSGKKGANTLTQQDPSLSLQLCRKHSKKKKESIYYTCVGFIIEQYRFFLFVVFGSWKTDVD